MEKWRLMKSQSSGPLARPSLPSSTPTTNESNFNTNRNTPYSAIITPNLQSGGNLNPYGGISNISRPSTADRPNTTGSVRNNNRNSNNNNNTNNTNNNNDSFLNTNAFTTITTINNLSNSFDQNQNVSIDIDQHLHAQEKILRSMVTNLQYSDRESILALFGGLGQYASNYEKKLEALNNITTKLRIEMAQKQSEIEMRRKTEDMFREKNRHLQDTIDSMRDQFDIQQKFTVRNKRVVARLSHTNRILIDSLEALGVGNRELESHQTAEKAPRKGLLRPMSYNEIQSNNDNRDDTNNRSSHNSHSPTKKYSDHQHKQQPTEGQDFVEDQDIMKNLSPDMHAFLTSQLHAAHTQLQNAPQSTEDIEKNLKKIEESKDKQFNKIREALLRLTRDHYKAVNLADAFELKNCQLEASMKLMLKTNKNLLLELNELKVKMSMEVTTESAALLHTNDHKARQKVKFDETENILKSLLNRSNIDTVDQFLQYRRIVYYSNDQPNQLSLTSVCTHMVSKEIAKIFEVELIALYIIHSNDSNNEEIHKFTMKSSKHETLLLSPKDTSILQQVLKTGRAVRHNHLSNFSLYNQDIDGTAGVISKRALCIPIKDNHSDKILGAFQLVNKSTEFTDYDDHIAMLLASSISPYFETWKTHHVVSKKNRLLNALLEASTVLFEVISPDARKTLKSGEILQKLESVTMDVLKCHKVRAFMVSDWIPTANEVGKLYMLDNNMSKSALADKKVSNLQVNTFKITTVDTTGVVGHVVRTKIPHEASSDIAGSTNSINPVVDIDVQPHETLFTVPIMNLSGDVIAVIQCVPGFSSPKVKLDADSPPDDITFTDAIFWLVHQLRSSAQYLSEQIGQPSVRPVSTPKPVASRSNVIVNRTNEPGGGRGSSPKAVSAFTRPLSAAAHRHVVPAAKYHDVSHAKKQDAMVELGAEVADEKDLQIEELHKKISHMASLLDTSNSKLTEIESQKKENLELKDTIEANRSIELQLGNEVKLLEALVAKYRSEGDTWSDQLNRAQNLEKKLLGHLENKVDAVNINHELKYHYEQSLDETKRNYNQRVQLLEADICILNKTFSTYNQDYLIQMDEINKKLETSNERCDQLFRKNQALEAELLQKEYTVKTLQEQIVKIANVNLQEIGNHLNSFHDELSADNNDAHEASIVEWGQQFDEKGNEYFTNSITGESVWELPLNVSLASKSYTSYRSDNTQSISNAKVHAAGAYKIEL